MDRSIEDAMRFISSELTVNPDANRTSLVTSASQKYDLTPNQTEFLTQKFVMEK